MTGAAAAGGGPESLDGASGRAAAVVLGALAWLGGTVLQLQQPALWPPGAQGAVFASALLAAALAWWLQGRWRMLCVVVALCLAAFALTATRAHWRLAEALPPALEGRDLVVTGVVAQMPRRSADGVRFVFSVEQATHGGLAVDVPNRVSLGWYRGGSGDDDGLATPQAPYDGLAAGQRWRFTARLGAPHGSLNPHGFDHELWLFEQGIRAVGSVRASTAARPS